MKDNKEFMQLLDKATAFHGHLCTGQIVGVRIAMLGLRELGLFDPLGADRKKIIVFVEVARCAADAIMTVTGCRVGKRSFKIVNNGKMAATFFNMVTGQAVRVGLQVDIAATITKRYPGQDEKAAEKKAYMEMADDELFSLQNVKISLKDENTPGTPVTRARCTLCGETILDKRDVQQEDRIFCRPCATGQSYYILDSAVPEKLEEEIF
jgi:formylmethanofuran dehydrogenase subunit E